MAPSRPTSSQVGANDVPTMSAASWNVSPATSPVEPSSGFRAGGYLGLDSNGVLCWALPLDYTYGQYAELELVSGADPQQILQRLVASGARLSKFELQEASLNKIFIDLVGPDAARAEVRPDA